MKKINVLKICYWCLLFTSGFMLATVFPKWTFKGFTMPIIIMLCAFGAGYVDRMIDEEKNNYDNN